MFTGRVAAAAFSVLAAAAVAIGTAGTASADLVWPDPTDPYYWDANENAGSTGPAPLPTDDLYWKDEQDAGGTGNAPQPGGLPYYDEGPNAGAY